MEGLLLIYLIGVVVIFFGQSIYENFMLDEINFSRVVVVSVFYPLIIATWIVMGFLAALFVLIYAIKDYFDRRRENKYDN